MDGLQIERASLSSAPAQALIAALNAELDARYPEPGANHFRLDEDEVAPGRGAFLLASLDERAIGCGAVRRIGGAEGEIKRMYVAPGVRGRGIGGAILAALGAEAQQLGLSRLVLETGERQPEALALYARFGFARIPLFGEYVDSPLSVCMAKELKSTTSRS